MSPSHNSFKLFSEFNVDFLKMADCSTDESSGRQRISIPVQDIHRDFTCNSVFSWAVNRSPSRSSGLDRSESMLYGGSMGQLNGGGNVYLPDYSVRQLTHLQIIKVPPPFSTVTLFCPSGV